MKFKVFYAWQSDRDERVCRYLIRDAAKKAIKKLAAQVRVDDAPALDHDTKDEPGTPHIADTIQRKIRRCGVFFADLTSVSNYTTADGRNKQTPNPNVLIELGMAVRSIGWSRILLVMNTVYGSPDDLPFDLKHHGFPILYKLDGNDGVKTAREELAGRLFTKLDLIIRSGILDAAELGKSVKVKISCQKAEATTQQHVRWLVADVVNTGGDLNDVYVILEYPGKGGKLVQCEMSSVGRTPNPFAKGFSCRFTTYNNDPTKPLEALAGVPPEQIAVVVHSRIREVARLPATRWLKELDAFRQADPSMPQAPPPPRREQSGYYDWVHKYRNKY